MRLFLITALACAIAPSAWSEATYSKEISRLMQAKCEICHREGDIGPFVLDSYTAAVTWGEDIQRVVASRQMPPWKPVPGHGEFKGSFGLSAEEREMILAWYQAGAPEGESADLPEPLPANSGWQLGEPDVVVQMPVLYEVPRRKDIYRCFVVPTGMDEDVWLKALEIIPGNRQVVHHVILYLDPSNKSSELDAKDEEPGYECFGGPGEGIPLTAQSMAGGWVPGVRAHFLPGGVGIHIPKGAKLIMQMHYFPGGKLHADQTKVGMYISKEKIQKNLSFIPLVNTTFRIPAGAANYEVTASLPVIPLLTAKMHIIVPHMHLLGTKIKVEKSNLLSRAKEDLIYVDDWDFNWQGFYNYVEPVPLRAFDTLKLTCHFDNSEKNPRNPSNPLKIVRWGEGTEDEMCLAFMGVTFDNENITDLIKFNRDKR